MNELFTKLGVLNENQTVSITNVIVMIFVAVTAFRSMFGGVVIDLKWFDWKIESLDISSTLPLLFGLLNYGHKRTTLTPTKETNESK